MYTGYSQGDTSLLPDTASVCTTVEKLSAHVCISFWEHNSQMSACVIQGGCVINSLVQSEKFNKLFTSLLCQNFQEINTIGPAHF